MRTVTRLLAVVLALGLLAAPASAHILVVDPPGNDKVIGKWIGGPPDALLPIQAQGEGLFPAPPFAPGYKQPAAHGTGLIAACKATTGNGVVTIVGPGMTVLCEHSP